MALRFDEAATIEPVRLPSGAYRIDARHTRIGVLPYRMADGSTRLEYRPPEEVFAEESLSTLRGAAVTDLHPDEPVTPDTWPRLAKGHVGDDVRAEAPFVAASVVVHAADLIAKIEAKERREISLGYDCEIEETPGETPEGERYDVIQRRIRYNHAALGPEGWGRAGPQVRLRLDGGDEGCSPAVMVKVQIQGIAVEVPESVAAELEVRAKRLDALTAEIPKRVQKRIELLESARARKVKHDAAMGDDELIAAIVAKAFPTLPLEKLALSHEQLMAMLEASAGVSAEPEAPAADAAEEPKKDPAAPAPPAPPAEEKRMDAAEAGRPPLDPPGAGTPTKSPLELAREKARERDAAAFKRKAS